MIFLSVTTEVSDKCPISFSKAGYQTQLKVKRSSLKTSQFVFKEREIRIDDIPTH